MYRKYCKKTKYLGTHIEDFAYTVYDPHKFGADLHKKGGKRPRPTCSICRQKLLDGHDHRPNTCLEGRFCLGGKFIGMQ